LRQWRLKQPAGDIGGVAWVAWAASGVLRLRQSSQSWSNSGTYSPLSTHFGKGKVRIRGHGADWVVRIDTAPTSVEHRRELETKVWELIDRSNIGLGGGYSIDI
jgi:hypothetical protein